MTLKVSDNHYGRLS